MKAVGIIANSQKPQAAEAIKRLKKLLNRAGVAVRLEKEAARLVGARQGGCTIPEMAAMSDMLIVLGGDGTMLRAVRELGDIPTPLLGVNLGGLGFLTCIPLENMEAAVRSVLQGGYEVMPRSTLQVRVCRHGCLSEPSYALNDVVVSRGAVLRIIKIAVRIDGQSLASYQCDGIVFATPTGSTAYSLSAAGPILAPESRVFVITPICPHPSNYPPLVVPPTAVAEVSVVKAATGPVLTVDGQVQMMLRVGDVVEVTGGSRTVQLVTLRGRSYYIVLREKLKWSG